MVLDALERLLHAPALVVKHAEGSHGAAGSVDERGRERLHAPTGGDVADRAHECGAVALALSLPGSGRIIFQAVAYVRTHVALSLRQFRDD